jgi:hypothetical protein
MYKDPAKITLPLDNLSATHQHQLDSCLLKQEPKHSISEEVESESEGINTTTLGRTIFYSPSRKQNNNQQC